jgi:hypothetical protein
VQREFAAINARLRSPRDPMSDQVVQNMLAGYAFVDELLASGIDLFSLHHLPQLLELNSIVLCGTSRSRRAEFADHLQATETRFYEDKPGVRDVLEWYDMHRNDSAWFRAGGTLIRVISKPQLYIEGNHRSATLAASWILGASGEPPFVLSVENAAGYFEPTSVIRETAKHGAVALFRLPGFRRRLARFLKSQADPRYLLPSHFSLQELERQT